jgi:NAD(P)-dependent dehydrogenase (short-subunit alcohol dehydrogenase family)
MSEARLPPKRWLITGVSGGLGRAIAVHALGRGDVVTGTVRRADQVDAFAALAAGRAHSVMLDVSDDALTPAVTGAIAAMGGIDVLVNNAGYCLVGAVEDLSLAEARQEMETNFFGTLKLIQAVVPHFREQGRGRIVNIASVAGAAGIPLFGLYSASKFAVVGLSAALAKELAPFGIKVTAVEPGGLRTDFGGASLRVSAVVSPPYAAQVETIAGRMALAGAKAINDPAKAAAAIAALVDMDEPPVHAAIGADGLRAVRAALEARLADYARAPAFLTDTAADPTS